MKEKKGKSVLMVVGIIVLALVLANWVIPETVMAVRANSKLAKAEAQALITASLGEAHADEALVEQVAKELAMLKRATMVSDVAALTLDETGAITYLVPVDGELQDEIQVRRERNGNIVLDIQEGELYNELIIRPFGKMLLNGKKVG